MNNMSQVRVTDSGATTWVAKEFAENTFNDYCVVNHNGFVVKNVEARENNEKVL
jgi:hypothetical protein